MQPCQMRSTELEMPSNGFSYFQTFNSIVTQKNFERVLKISGSLIKGHLSSSASLKTDANIYLATNVHHRLYKIFETSDRLNFGELLLISSRNIAEKAVLRDEADKTAYIFLRNTLYQAKEENNLESIIGYNKDCLTDDYLQTLHPDSPLKSVNTNGLCASVSLYLIGKMLTDPGFDETILIEWIRELQKGVPAEAAAKQELYHEFDFDIVGPKVFDISNDNAKKNLVNSSADILLDRAERFGIDVTGKELQQTIESILESEHIQFKITQSILFSELKKEPLLHQVLKDFEPKAVLKAEKYRNNALAHLYGFKQDIEGTFLADAHFGKSANFASSKEHLNNFEKLETGIYQMTFKTLVESHSIVYIKQEDGNGYFFDPNKGLITCGNYSHASIMLKLLSSYPPPSDRLQQENNDRNYQINLTKYSRIRNG